MEKEKICCIIGEQQISTRDINWIVMQLSVEIKKLINDGVTTFISGGVIGFDTIAASMIIALKEEYPHIKLIFALPYKNHSRYWKKKNLPFYEQLLTEADEIYYTSDKFFSNSENERDRFMAENSKYFLCHAKNNKLIEWTNNVLKEYGITIIHINVLN